MNKEMHRQHNTGHTKLTYLFLFFLMNTGVVISFKLKHIIAIYGWGHACWEN